MQSTTWGLMAALDLVKLVCLLNPLVRFDERSGIISYEPDPRHAEIILKELEMETCKPVKSANEKMKAEDVLKRLELQAVEPAQVSKYRSLVMRAAFLAQDRPDLSETVKCLAKEDAKSNGS